MGHDWTRNPVTDGFFVDLYDQRAYLRQTDYGFDKNQFDRNVPVDVFDASGLTYEAIASAMARARQNGGGIVRLPAGTGNLSKPLGTDFSSGIVLEGAGQERTKLVYSGTGDPMHVRDRRDVVIRDLTLDCAGRPTYGINFEYAENVLVERCTVMRATNGNIRCRFVSGVTIRFCTVSDCVRYHGIAIKDIFENGQFRDEAYCRTQFNGAPHTYGAMFTQNQAIYSNHCIRNGGNGINDHGIQGEICGNLSEANSFGGKSFDGRHLMFHRNTFRNNSGRGWGLYATIPYPGRSVGYLTFCRNRFLNNGGYDLGLYTSGGYGTFNYEGWIRLDDNVYSPVQGKTNIVNQPGAAHVEVCSESTDLTSTWSNRGYRLVSVDECLACRGDESPAPTATASFVCIPRTGSAPAAICGLDTSVASEPIVAWKWYVGDRQVGTGQLLLHTIDEAGQYDVTLEIETLSGFVASETKSAHLIVGEQPEYGQVGSMYVGVASASDVFWRWHDGFEAHPTAITIGDVAPTNDYDHTAGFRFVLPESIPAYAEVVSAYLLLHVNEAQSNDGIALRIWAENSQTSRSFINDADFDTRSRTPSSVTWQPGEPVSGRWIATPNLAQLLQELVAEYGGLPANAGVTLLVGDADEGFQDIGHVTVSGYAGEGAWRAQLLLTYQTFPLSLVRGFPLLRIGVQRSVLVGASG